MRLYFTTTPEQERQSVIVAEISKTLCGINDHSISKKDGKQMLFVLYQQIGCSEKESQNLINQL